MKYSIYLLALLISMSMTSCLGPTQDEEDEDIIQEYIKKNNLSPTKHASGLYYIIKTEGSGVNPTTNNKVTVHYKGYLTNGTQFDGTGATPASFGLNQVIAGWQIGIPLIKKGGEIKLIIPSILGYGAQSPSSSIPANSVLVFDVQLLDIK